MRNARLRRTLRITENQSIASFIPPLVAGASANFLKGLSCKGRWRRWWRFPRFRGGPHGAFKSRASVPLPCRFKNFFQHFRFARKFALRVRVEILERVLDQAGKHRAIDIDLRE